MQGVYGYGCHVCHSKIWEKNVEEFEEDYGKYDDIFECYKYGNPKIYHISECYCLVKVKKKLLGFISYYAYNRVQVIDTKMYQNHYKRKLI